MKTPKQLRNDIQTLTPHLSQLFEHDDRWLAAHRPTLRRVRATENDVFIVPGHALA